jgi:hypothetical protein
MSHIDIPVQLTDTRWVGIGTILGPIDVVEHITTTYNDKQLIYSLTGYRKELQKAFEYSIEHSLGMRRTSLYEQIMGLKERDDLYDGFKGWLGE